MVRSKIYRLDFFGLPVTLSYLNDYKYRTNFGLCLSCSFFISIVFYLIANASPILFNQNNRSFNYVVRVNYEDDPDGFSAGNGDENFKIAFGLQDSETADHILDQSIYGARAKYIFRSKKDDVKKSTTLTFSAKIKPCDTDYFQGIQNQLSDETMKNLYCLSEDQAVLPQEYQDMKIRGRFDSQIKGNYH